jgi:hypothetical protein
MFGLSLMVVVLAIGCFAFPLEEFSSSTYSPLEIRSLGDQETTEFPSLRSFTDGIDIETSTFSYLPVFPKEVSRKQRTFGEFESSESFTSTTILPFNLRDVPNLSFTSAEETTESIHHNLRSLPIEKEKEDESESESESDKREVLELTTSYMPLFTSTSSAVAPKYYKSESLTSTQKYVGHLDESSEEGSESNKFPKSKFELTTESFFPAAQLDQKAADLFPYIPNGVMILEENTTAVTSIPEKLETTTLKKLKEEGSEEKFKPKFGRKLESEDPLNQGKEPSFTEAPQPDN